MTMKLLGQKLEKKDIAHIIPRLIVVFIIGQTLPFKYSGHPDSVWIFEQMGWEPWGRYMIAIIETSAVILLLTSYYILGAIISLSLISAANFMHFTRLGFDINGDGGTLFTMSIIVIISSLTIVIIWNRSRLSRKNTAFHLDLGDDDFEEV